MGMVGELGFGDFSLECPECPMKFHRIWALAVEGWFGERFWWVSNMFES